MSFLNSIKRNKAKTERVIIYGESGWVKQHSPHQHQPNRNTN